VVEVETAESVNHLEAMSQWAAFSRLRTPFHLYVPQSMIDVARRLCEDMHIPVAEIWAYQIIGDQPRFTLVQRSDVPEMKVKPAAPVRPAAAPRPASANGETRARARTVTPRRKVAAKKSARPANRRAPARKTAPRAVRAASKKSASGGRAQKRK
jgi:hypothetical protein